MTDWTMLGGDPVPGSPAGLRAVADEWQTCADSHQNVAADLADETILLSGAWRDSPGASAFGRSLRGPRAMLDGTASVLAGAARTLHAYADRLESWQTNAAALGAVAAGVPARLAADREAVADAALPGLPDPFSIAGRMQAAAAAQLDAADATTTLARLQRDAHHLAADARAAAQATAREIADAGVALAGWCQLTAILTPGHPAEGSMISSTAYRQYADSYVRRHPPLFPADPRVAAARWHSMDPIMRSAYLRGYPGLLGNTAGIDLDDRNRANRSALRGILDEARRRTAAAGRPVAELAVPSDSATGENDPNRVLADLRAAGYSASEATSVTGALAVDRELRRLAAEQLPGCVPRLVIFDPAAFDGKGRAAIALGDAATARNVAVLVPGMTSDLTGYLSRQVTNAQNVYRATDDGGRTAVIAWVGYDAPGTDPDVVYQAKSWAGASLLAADLAGFAAARTAGAGRVTVIAHSYGSTTAATAFASRGAKADALVLIGSPGAGTARTVTDLGLPANAVFVGSESFDPVTTIVQQAQDRQQVGRLGPSAANSVGGPELGGLVIIVQGITGISVVAPAIHGDLGVDPAGQRFGAVRFHAETPDKALVSSNHSRYYEPGSESLTNISRVVTGDVGSLTRAELRPESGDHFQGVDPERGHRPDG